MSVRRRQNWLGQQRVDSPHLKSVESAVSNDFDELISGLVIGENKSYIIRGLKINMPGSIGASANGLQLLVEESAVLHGNSDQSGTFYTIPIGTPPEILSSTTNERVEGAFTPSTDNYVGLEFTRAIDDSTTDQVYFWNPTTNVEITKTVPLAITMDYKIVIATSSFAANVLPIAVVQTDSSNNVISITDRRPLLHRLGTAGDLSPNPFYSYPWAEGRTENFYTSNSSTLSPFEGGDKQITNMKEFFDALMTEFKLLKGTPFWYSESVGGSIARLRQDTANTAFTGRGNIGHDSVTPGKINWSQDVFLNFIGGRLRYKIAANPISSNITLSNNEVAYVKLIRGVGIIPNLVFTNSGSVVTSVGSVNWTTDLQPGDFIKDASRGDEFYYEIQSIDSTFQVTLTEPYQELSSGLTGFNAEYAFGVYETNPAPITDRHIRVASRGQVPFGQDYFWLLYRQDDTGSLPKVYVRMLGGQELEQGEEREISDNTSLDVLAYMGSANESDSTPDYTNALGVARTNIHLIDDENLTRGLKRLEQRDDVIPRVRVVDLISTSLPTGASVTIDGETLNDNDYVFFINSPIEGLYKVSGVGVSVAFEKLHSFGGQQQPVDGDLIRVEAGTSYLKTVWKRVSGYWKPLEVKDATKEPTGFPNRTDSQISFNNLTRTFSVAPLAPSDHFDIFAKGRVFRFNTAQTISVPDTEGIFFFYFETDGTLNYSTVFDLTIITEKVFISTIYWDVDNQQAILVGDERHGITMDGATHEYLHNLNGAVVTSGGSISFPTYVENDIAAQFQGQVTGMTTDVTIDADVAGAAGNITLVADGIKDIDTLISDWNTANPGNTVSLFSGNGSQIPTDDIVLSGGVDGSGDLDSDAQVTLGNIVFRDEDIRMNIVNSASPSLPFEQVLDPVAEVPVFYRDGASGNWRKEAATSFPVKQGATRIQWNNPTGPWTQQDVQDEYYVSMWVFATNNFSEPVIAILGQKEHASLSDAQEQDTYDSLSFGQMPTQEFKVLYRLIFKSASAFANTPKATLVDVRDLRAAEDTQFAQVAPNDHGLLSGLADPDHAPTAVTTAGVIKDGGFSSSDVDVKQSLETLNKLFGQLRVKEHPSNKKRIVVTGSDRILNNGQKLIQSLKNLVLSFEGAEIDFETGLVVESDGVTPLGVNFTPATITASEYFNYSITLIPSAVNLDNTITAQLIVLPAATSNAVKALAPKAAFAKGIQLGQVTVQENAGGIQNITQADVSQLGTGGGGAGGAGDANSFTENLKHRLISSFYEFVTPVVFEIDEDNLTEDATASFDIANGVYSFGAASEYVETVNLFGEEFLDSNEDSRRVELHAEWFEDDTRDDNAIYEAALNGVDFETIVMTRQGLSEKFTGDVVLSIPPSVTQFDQPNTTQSSELNTSTRQAIATKFTVAQKMALNELVLQITKTGTPGGSYIVSIVEDDSNSPEGEILYSRIALNSTLSAGVNVLTLNNFRKILTPGDYWVKIETDATYKASFNTTVDSISVDSDVSGSDSIFDGTIWSVGSDMIYYELSGHVYDLRIKITSSAADKELKAIGVFYDEKVGSVVTGYQNLQKFRFSGDLNQNTFVVTGFLPHPDFLKIYDIRTAQVYRHPSFEISGHNIIFEDNTFLAPGEEIELIFDQSEGTGFDFSDQNANLLAANHLGSIDPTVDKSANGRGIFLRRPDGTLREICIDDNDNIVIYSV